MTPRPYQAAGREAVHKAWQTYQKALVVWPTGTGKTILFSLLSSDILQQGGRVLILAHRHELLQQAQQKLLAATGIDSCVEKAEETAYGALERVTVGSVQTMMNLSRLDRFPRDYYSHIVVDECHHCLTDSYQRIFAYFDKAKVLGVTATPDRGDLRDLGRFFEIKAHEYLLPQAIADGFLCKIRAQMIPLKIDLNSVNFGTNTEDEDIGNALEPYIPQIAAELWKCCQSRKLLIFAPLCAIAQKIRDAMAAVGFKAFYASGEYRDEMKEWNAAGKGACMVNAMLLTEGYDHPLIDAVCFLRPTRSRSLYAQACGRGTRIHPLKEYLLIPDFLWLSEKYSLCHPAHLLAESDEVADIMVKRSEAGAGGGEEDIDMESVETAQAEFLQKREEALAKKLAEQRRKKAKLVDPLQFAVSIGDEGLADYQPTMPDEMKPATLEQLKFLEEFGLATTDMSSGMAAKAQAAIERRRTQNLALPKQIRLLERFGFQHVGRMKRGEAGILISRISANNWRVPENLSHLCGKTVIDV